MRVRLVDLEARIAAVRPQLDRAIADVIDSGRFVLGAQGERLENAMAACTGAEHAVGCGSGSDAVLLSLMALDIGPGDQVIVPSLTFISTATAVARLGAEVVFADVERGSLTLDAASVERAAEGCSRLRAIVNVHLFGRCAEGDGLRAIAERHGAELVQDAAQAIGAHDSKGTSPGGSGELTAFSFYPTKSLGALGDAGLVTTSNPARAETLRQLRVHGEDRSGRHDAIGLNSRLDELQAAVLNVMLPRLESEVAQRNAHADEYDARFTDRGATERGLQPPERPPAGARHAFHHYVIRVPATQRDPLAEFLSEHRIETARYYRLPLHQQPAFAGRSRGTTSLPETERAGQELLALPVHPAVTDSDRARIVDAVTEFLER